MPGPGASIWKNLSVLTEPVFREVLKGFTLERLLSDKRLPVDDESVATFLSRIFGPKLTDNVVSAVLHGIYAGDVDQLSAKSILGPAWFLDRLEDGLLVNAYTGWQKMVTVEDYNLQSVLKHRPEGNQEQEEFRQKLKDCSVFTFKGGIQKLASRLEEALRRMANVTIKTNTAINSLRYAEDDKASQVGPTFRVSISPSG